MIHSISRSLLTLIFFFSFEPLNINDASDEEILALPFFSKVEAMYILEEREKRPFNNFDDFRERVPLSLASLTLARNLLDFSSYNRRRMKVEFHGGIKIEGGKAGMKLRGCMETRSFSLRLQMKKREVSGRFRVDFNRFKLQGGSYIPGKIAFLIGKRGFLGPYRSAFLSKRSISMELEGLVAFDTLLIGLTRNPDELSAYMGITKKFETIPIAMEVLIGSNRRPCWFLDGKFTDEFFLGLGSSRDTLSMWFRAEKGASTSKMTITVGIDRGDFTYHSLLRVGAPRRGFSIWVNGSKERFLFNSSYKFPAEIPLKVHFDFLDREGLRIYSGRIGLVLPLDKAKVSTFWKLLYSEGHDKYRMSRIGLSLFWGHFFWEGSMSVEIGELITQGDKGESLKRVSDVYKQRFGMSSRNRGLILYFLSTQYRSHTFWSIYLGFRMKA